MSEALDYLLKVRPQAMKSYFAFLKEAGGGLDPKTRAIISVITKVDAQSERGFRQYLSRALREGVTADEILDAMLLAFPTLGLTKITWAVDILLAMDIPDFDPERLGRTAAWHDVADLADIPDGRASRLQCDDRGLFVFRDGDEIRVYDSRCPHQATDIPETALDGFELACPKHSWRFDVRSGRCIDKGNRPLRRFEHRIDGSRLMAFW